MQPVEAGDPDVPRDWRISYATGGTQTSRGAFEYLDKPQIPLLNHIRRETRFWPRESLLGRSGDVQLHPRLSCSTFLGGKRRGCSLRFAPSLINTVQPFSQNTPVAEVF